MTHVSHTESDTRLIGIQMGRQPREPWAVVSRCSHGYPNAIVSPPVLADGTPFPTWAWLTCPYLVEAVSDEESRGGVRSWAQRLAAEPDLAEQVLAADSALRALRAEAGEDPCPEVGIGGQRDPLKTKCLHTHVALALAGLADPVGSRILESTGERCPDRRCGTLLESAADAQDGGQR